MGMPLSSRPRTFPALLQEYAESRMTTYYNMKGTLPASEFPNGEDQFTDVPGYRRANCEVFDMESVNTKADGEPSNPNAETSFYVTDED